MQRCYIHLKRLILNLLSSSNLLLYNLVVFSETSATASLRHR